jgi:hypothetical protein
MVTSRVVKLFKILAICGIGASLHGCDTITPDYDTEIPSDNSSQPTVEPTAQPIAGPTMQPSSPNTVTTGEPSMRPMTSPTPQPTDEPTLSTGKPIDKRTGKVICEQVKAGLADAGFDIADAQKTILDMLPLTKQNTSDLKSHLKLALKDDVYRKLADTLEHVKRTLSLGGCSEIADMMENFENIDVPTMEELWASISDEYKRTIQLQLSGVIEVIAKVVETISDVSLGVVRTALEVVQMKANDLKQNMSEEQYESFENTFI